MSAWAKSKANDIQRFSKTAASTALPPLRGNKHRALGRAPHGLPRFSGSGRDAMTVQPKARQRSEVGAWCDTGRTNSSSRDRFREAAQRRPAIIAATLSWSAGYAQSCRSMSNGKSPTPSTAYSKRSAMNVTSGTNPSASPRRAWSDPVEEIELLGRWPLEERDRLIEVVLGNVERSRRHVRVTPDKPANELLTRGIQDTKRHPHAERLRFAPVAITFLATPESPVEHNIAADFQRPEGNPPLQLLDSCTVFVELIVRLTRIEIVQPLVRGQANCSVLSFKTLGQRGLPGPLHSARDEKQGHAAHATRRSVPSAMTDAGGERCRKSRAERARGRGETPSKRALRGAQKIARQGPERE